MNSLEKVYGTEVPSPKKLFSSNLLLFGNWTLVQYSSWWLEICLKVYGTEVPSPKAILFKFLLCYRLFRLFSHHYIFEF
jgi:hypothetical protein